jgi:hypothetical protein
VALRRRTDAMLSSAIKQGTTDHLAPHAYQEQGNAGMGVPPLKWRKGDTLGNVQAMIDTSLASLTHDVPEITGAHFDFTSRTFRTGEGVALSDEAMDKWGNALRRDRAAGAGRATLKRGLLLGSLSRAEGGKRPGLLAQVLSEQGQRLLGSGLRETFYSIPETEALIELGGSDPTWKGRMAQAFEDWRRTLQDRHLPMLKVQREIEDQTGKTLPEMMNPYPMTP